MLESTWEIYGYGIHSKICIGISEPDINVHYIAESIKIDAVISILLPLEENRLIVTNNKNSTNIKT